MSGKRRIFFASVLALLLCTALDAHAAEEAINSAQHSAENIFKWINFAIVAAAVVWLFAKVLRPKFRSNAEKIGSAITQATQSKAEADRRLREAETQLAGLEKEVAELRTAMQREAAAEAQRLQEATQNDARKVAEAAHSEIAASERAARLELKALAANLAADRAESLLAQQLTPGVQESIFSNFVKSLEGRPN
jgi:F0F1-type ATP synthase membrane subunit b/b'